MPLHCVRNLPMTALTCVSEMRALAQRDGVAVEFADLGDWGDATLLSEYEPSGPVIRINLRVLTRCDGSLKNALIEFAVAHELFHHRERVGSVPRAANRRVRERAADAFARAHVTLEPALAAFLGVHRCM
jgi:hypothetical protein